ncbi:MAG: hypothetical protein LH461_03110 [Spirochaetaceae bacterium]|nr:hypothetical protein [Spirochaetaceae bacterium]
MSVSASGQGGFPLRVAPEDSESLLLEAVAEEFTTGQRGPMKGWLRINPVRR